MRTMIAIIRKLLKLSSHYAITCYLSTVVNVVSLHRLLHTRAFRFTIRIDSRFVLGKSIRFVKKSAIRFGCCNRLINDHMPIFPYSAVVRVIHDD